MTRYFKIIKLNLFLFFLLYITNCYSQNKEYSIKKAKETIKIDGKLDESDWAISEVATDFWMNFPVDTLPAKTKTSVRLTYSDLGIYVGAICYDTVTKPYVISSLKRDFSVNENDAFIISLDPFLDQTNGFSFGCSPYGVQREGLIEDRGIFGVTTSWDNRWFVETQINQESWTVEMFIPFKTIRYKPGAPIWGINFTRINQKINENSCWYKVSRNFNVSMLASVGKLIWDCPPPAAGVNISIIPYVTARSETDYIAKTSKFAPNAGLSAKIGITSSLNLDLTVNPDFSQVDVDVQVTNLSRFSLFFPERREFFLENSDLFARFGFSKIRPFFSRRIGLENGKTVPILFGARLSGKINQNWRIGLMDTQTEGSLGLNSQNFFVAAVQRQVFEKSNIAVIIVNKQAFDGLKPLYGQYNRVVGLDYNLASKNNKWFGKIFYHRSFSPNQQADNQSQAVWIMYSVPKWQIHYNHEYVGQNYNVETGFVPRPNIIRFEPNVIRKFFPKHAKINNYVLNLYTDWYLTREFSSLDQYNSISGDINFHSSSYISGKIARSNTFLYFPFDVTNTGGTPLPVASYQFFNGSIGMGSNKRKLLSINGIVDVGTYFLGQKYTGLVNLIYRIQPFGNISLSAEHNKIKQPTPYKSADITLIGTKFEITFTKSLFFTTFLQYNTQINNFNINARFQWRYAPMSDLFIVYTDNYDTRWMGIKNRAIVLKFNYWFTI